MWSVESVSLAEMVEFLSASQETAFSGRSRQEVYAWVQRTLVEQEHFREGEKQHGVIRTYLSKVTGLSLSQMTRLIRQYRQTGRIEARTYRRHRFLRRYTQADIAVSY